jgi:hypothetical protein
MAQNRVDLVNIFQTVSQNLAQNQPALDQADEYNHDHGTNMVQTFQTITNSLQQKQARSASTALTYAAKNLAKNTTSGSGKLYAQGLTQAASKFKGKSVDSKGALDLLQTLISGGQTTPQSGGGDLLGSLLGQMTAGGQSQPSETSQPGGDMLSSLLGGLTGSQSGSSGSNSGFDLEDLVNAGKSFMQAKQQGGSTAQALIQAFMSASGMGNRAERTQSTQLVVNSFLQALASAQKPG